MCQRRGVSKADPLGIKTNVAKGQYKISIVWGQSNKDSNIYFMS